MTGVTSKIKFFRFPTLAWIPGLKTKNPSSDYCLKGCTQFTWPFLIKRSVSVARRALADWQGRSSGSPALLATFPSRWIETVAFAAKRVLFSFWQKERGYSGGTAPGFNGIPY
jgi:hypothetical protein